MVKNHSQFAQTSGEEVQDGDDRALVSTVPEHQGQPPLAFVQASVGEVGGVQAVGGRAHGENRVDVVAAQVMEVGVPMEVGGRRGGR